MDSKEEAIKILKNGGVAIFPTDTAFGIGCRMDDEKAVKRVFEVRKRFEGNPLLILVDSIEMAEGYSIFDNRSLKFAKKYWPGGITMILPCKKDAVLRIVRANGKSIAVRIPRHKDILEIIKQVGVPIVAPSANLSGEKTPYLFNELDQRVVKQADAILKGQCTFKKESTIIDTTVKPWKIIRQGAVEVDMLDLKK